MVVEVRGGFSPERGTEGNVLDSNPTGGNHGGKEEGEECEEEEQGEEKGPREEEGVEEEEVTALAASGPQLLGT